MSINTRTSFSLKTIASSETAISLHPDWGYLERNNTIKRFERTQGGQLNAYSLVSSWQAYSLPITFISSEYSSDITSWWKTDTLVNLNVGDGEVKCRISNKREPFPRNVRGRFSDFSGILNLTTVD